ncbi:DALR anticodon-binding domain-containing protein 3 isoform X1 [Pseudomyrmex gracilis]|uniref:DALR anticodon-binding domain-containing protein 3 isoform X1 n=2 Tax=Pseudomyrmex gracilis TaxID=219809 RepID=UPI0009950A41|nr:DALR anticodon-binding domain-containing protein 3 isoform X1 [Pseudomyrmex gracilis]
MESWTNFAVKSLTDNIVFHFTGNVHKNSFVIKTNSENLSVNGELHFLWSFKAWKNLVDCTENCASILQHFAHTHDAMKSNVNTAEEVLKLLTRESDSWPVKIHKCSLQKERVCLFLNRGDILANSIRMAIEHGMMFGRSSSNGKTFSLKYQPDAQSDLTTRRLSIMRDVAAKVLNLHGYVLSPLEEKNCAGKYVFTSKSEGHVDEEYRKYVCGVVKNSQSNLKETDLTWEQYVKCKVNQLAELNEYKIIESERSDEQKNLFLHTLASAIVIFELMAVKPSRAVVIGNNNNLTSDKNVTNTKGASFVLYNTARIAAIIAKYNERVSCEDYPSLPNIQNVDFSQLNEEEEWELVYNFIFGYPQMIDACVKCEPNFHVQPQLLCLFLLRLCQKFSVYYRKIKILMEGDHLIPKMVARIYMLHALQVVFENALDILSIKPVSRM